MKRNLRRALIAIGAFALLLLLGPTGAEAGTGDLTFAGCIANAGALGCTDPFQDPLDALRGVAASSDGKSVYAVSWQGDAISHFARETTGFISFGGCVGNAGVFGCTDPFQDPLDGPYDVAVTPDGNNVYVVSANAASISHFNRDAAGGLVFAGCIANNGTYGCINPPMDPLQDLRSVAVSPDGKSVYAVSASGAAISHFTRGAGGFISFAGCIANNGAFGCINPAQDSLAGADGVAVSPDGKSVYVVSDTAASLSHFTRDADGNLAFAGCVANAGANGCIDPFQDPLAGADGVAVAPNGSSVYVVATSPSNSISHFTRDAAGNVGFAGCIANSGSFGCIDPVSDALGFALDVAVSPDGASAYAVAYSGKAISNFSLDGSGRLSFLNCVANNGAFGCTNPSIDALDGAASVVVSPDNASVYVASTLADAIVRFDREKPPPPQPPPPNPGTRTAGGTGTGTSGGTQSGGGGTALDLKAITISPSAFRAASRGGSITRRSGATVSYTLSAAADVRFTVERLAAGRRVGSHCVRKRASNRSRPRCSRYVLLRGSFIDRGTSGTNYVHFTGRLSGGSLRKGRYRLSAVANDGQGGKAGPRRARFRILAPHKRR